MFLPIMLNLQEKKIIVIGGGQIAKQKIEKLVEYGGTVIVVSLTFLPELKTMGEHVLCVEKTYEKSDIQGAFFVISATNDRLINETVYNDCHELGILCNVVDVPDLCDFIFTSCMKRGDLIISASTSGKSPMLGQRIIRKLKDEYDESWEERLNLLGQIRERLKVIEKRTPIRNKMLKSLLDKEIKTLKRIDATLERKWGNL